MSGRSVALTRAVVRLLVLFWILGLGWKQKEICAYAASVKKSPIGNGVGGANKPPGLAGGLAPVKAPNGGGRPNGVVNANDPVGAPVLGPNGEEVYVNQIEGEDRQDVTPAEPTAPAPAVPTVPSPVPNPSPENPSPENPSPLLEPPPPPQENPPTPSPVPQPTSPPPVAPSPPPPIAPPPPEDTPAALALLTFKNGITNADAIDSLASWQSGTDPCTWSGVGCNDGNIVSILLKGKGMEGTISSSLATAPLATLESIDLSENKLGESIPGSFDGRDALPKLVTLSLHGNSLLGGPPTFGRNGCKNLENFNFQNNEMGYFPQWTFRSMKVMRLDSNNLNTAIPEYIASGVPVGSTIVIMPQKNGRSVCGTPPTGPIWAEIGNDGTIQPLGELRPCEEFPPPTPPPPPTPVAPILSYPPPPAIIPPPPPPENPSEKSGLGTAAIIGISVGCGVGFIVLVVLLFLFCRPRRNKSNDTEFGDTIKYVESGDGADYDQRSDVFLNGAIMGPPFGNALIKQGSGITNGSHQNSLNQEGEENGTGSVGSHIRAPSSSSLPLDVKLWTVNVKDLQIERQIGEGSFGRVYLAKWNETLVAVKILMSGGSIEDDHEGLSLSNPVLTSLAKESNMMAALRHPNVVGFLGVCMEPPCIITEYCARGSMTDVFRGAKTSQAKASLLDWARRLNMALDAAKGMLYLHNHTPPIIHRDLKSPNLLVDKHWKVKVSDFNLSKLLEEGSVMSSMAATNPRWLAPEILGGNNATFASDVYSYGVVLWELLTWDLPWGVTNPWQVVTVVTEGGRLPIPSRNELPGPDTQNFAGLDAYIALMRRCWAHEPEDRPSFQEIISVLREILSRTLESRNGNGKVERRSSTSSQDAGEFRQDDNNAHILNSHSLDNADDKISTDVSGLKEELVEDEDDDAFAYASTGAMTGSLMDVASLNAAWSTRLKPDGG